MSALYLKQPGFTYSTCKMFTKHRQRIQKVKEKNKNKQVI